MTEEQWLEHAASRIRYEPETGEFFWKYDHPSKKHLAGDTLKSVAKNGYRRVGLCKDTKEKSLLLHRVAWFITYRKVPLIIDHINRNRQDNRLSNLREVTRGENQRNMSKYKRNTSGFTGVSKSRNRNTWRAAVMDVYIGSFPTKEDANTAVKEFRTKHGFTETHGH